MLKMVTAIEKGAAVQVMGKKLARSVLSALNGQRPALAVLFASSHLDLHALVQTIRWELAGVPLIGCTTAGEFTEQAVEKDSAALAVLSGSENYSFSVSSAKGLHADPAGCVQKAINAIPALAAAYPYRSAIFLHDGLAGRGEEAVVSAGSVLGPDIFFAGGAAADDLAFKQTWVACNDQVLDDAVVLAVIDSQRPVAIGVKHGHTPLTGTLTVTRAKDNVLFEVDGKPAWEVWKSQLAKEAKREKIEVERIETAAEVGQFLLRYELGLSTGRDYKVRIPLSKNPDGSLNFACTIPEGAKFRIMKGPKKEQIVSAEQAAKNAKTQMGRDKIAGAFIFDCACRGLILGPDFYQGVDAMKRIIGQVPLIGFETYGEVCKLPGQLSGLHNTTSVVMLLPV